MNTLGTQHATLKPLSLNFLSMHLDGKLPALFLSSGAPIRP